MGNVLIKLNSNELPFKQPTAILDILYDGGDAIPYYPDDHHLKLKEKIALLNDLRPCNVLVTAGSSEAISLATSTFVSFQDAIVTFKHAFQLYEICAHQQKRKIILARESESFEQDLDAILNSISRDTKLIFITNPSNPLGTWITNDRLLWFLEQVPDEITVVIDEAYCEFMCQEKQYSSAVCHMNKYKNILIVRTFSKLYGLAGLRIGYVLGHESLITQLQKNKLPFSLNHLAIALADKALEMKDYFYLYRDRIIQSRNWLHQKLSCNGFNPLANSANFLTFNYGSNVDLLISELKSRNILICSLKKPYNLNEFIRVSIGTQEEIEVFWNSFCELSESDLTKYEMIV